MGLLQPRAIHCRRISRCWDCSGVNEEVDLTLYPMAVTIRKNDVRAATLYFLSFLIHLLNLLLYPGSVVPDQFIFIGALVFTFVVCAAISAGIWAGYRWVKILFAALTLWETFSYLYKLPRLANAPGDKLLSLLALALQVCALVIVVKDLLTRQPQQPFTEGATSVGAAQQQ
jgi:hypothetical protein